MKRSLKKIAGFEEGVGGGGAIVESGRMLRCIERCTFFFSSSPPPPT